MPRREKEWRRNRKPKGIPQAETIHVFCEGQKTEPNYLKGLIRLIRKNPVYRNIKIEIHGDSDGTTTLLHHASSFVNFNKLKDVQVWCLYDKDNFSDFDKVVSQIDELNKRGSSVKYYAAWSNECFEIWLLQHFYYYSSDNGRDQYFCKLNNFFRSVGETGYKKEDSEIFEKCCKYGSLKRAINNSKKLLEGKENKKPSEIIPGTKVFELVEKLLEFLTIEDRNRLMNE